MDYKRVTVPITDETMIRKTRARTRAGIHRHFQGIRQVNQKGQPGAQGHRHRPGERHRDGLQQQLQAHFPGPLRKYTGIPEAVGGYLRCGMYVAALAIANFVMDFAVYEIISGFQAKYRMHADDIRMEVSHCIDSDDRCETFGIAGKAKLFGDSESESTVVLFYNARKGSAKAGEYIREAKRIRKEAEEQAATGKEAGIPVKYRKILAVSSKDGKISVEPDAKEFQRNVDRKVFSAIGSSRDLGADEISRIHHSRDASGKGFRSFKTDLGDDAMRTHFDSSMQTKFLVGFIASNIRNEFQKACKRAGQPTNCAKRELELLAVSALPDGSFKYVHTENTRQLEILGELGVDPRNLEEVATDRQRRKLTGDIDQRRSMTDYFKIPEDAGEGSGESPQAEEKTAEAGFPEVPKKKKEEADR